MTGRPKILYYCQSLVGIGHLACSLRIIEALLPQADVDLVQGGIGDASHLVRAGFRSVRLPALLHDETSGALHDPDMQRDTDAVWLARAAAIDRFLRMPYDAIVVEHYPFGRRRFKREILGLFDTVRESSGAVPIFASVRDVLVPREADAERRMLASIRKHIHTVFVRGDAAVLRLGETYTLAAEIADRICYSGYIAPPPLADPPPRTPRILVSRGGGEVGDELLHAAIGAAALMPDRPFLLAAGVRTSAAALGRLRSSVRSANVRIAPFLADFPRCLAGSALSISLGGDNTLAEVLAAGTPALAYPYQGNPEQGLRIDRFAAHGLVHALAPEDLAPVRLKAKIEAALAAAPARFAVRLDGAQATAHQIVAVLRAAALT